MEYLVYSVGFIIMMRYMETRPEHYGNTIQIIFVNDVCGRPLQFYFSSIHEKIWMSFPAVLMFYN